jgi:hypothetical protein
MAVNQVAGGNPQPTLDELTATPNMIAAARIGLNAALSVANDAAVKQVHSAVEGLQPGMNAVTVRGLLPPGFAKRLDRAIFEAAAGDSKVHGSINAVARDGNNGEPVTANRPPVISGSPATSIDIGQQYNFEPTATDLDDDALTWSIKSKPSWATFSASTGQLSGRPQAGDAGTYADIRISVSDGEDSSEMAPFSITVRDPNSATASATIDWTPPTENEDGSLLTDLTAYRIYWGTTSGVYPNSVTVNDPSATRYVVENLEPGSYEFVATAVNSAGIESRVSNAIRKTAQ